MKKLIKRLRGEGDKGLAHRPRARPSNNGHPAAVREQAPELIRGRYGDYGPMPAPAKPAFNPNPSRTAPGWTASVWVGDPDNGA